MQTQLLQRLTQPFGHLRQHPTLGRDIDRFAQAINEHQAVQQARRDPSVARDIHAEVKPVRNSVGRWHLARFYWSLQTADARAPIGFNANTLTFSAKSGHEGWSEFPVDTYLPALASWQARQLGMHKEPANSIRVLRYVPLRRFTFRVSDLDGASVISKIKRRSRFREAWNLLGIVHQAVKTSGVEFSVAKPLRLDEEQCTYSQSALSGQDLSTLIDASSGARLMRMVGALHRQLHGIILPSNLTLRVTADWLAIALADLDMIELLAPEPASELKNLADILRRHQPSDVTPAFCHGDFVCSQLLVGDETWSVTDFDLCHRGDPYREIAMLQASLPYDLPLGLQPIQNELEGAYVDGYQTTVGGGLDRPRLRWHRICAELYYLALALRKDRYEPHLHQSGLRTVRALAGELNRGS